MKQPLFLPVMMMSLLLLGAHPIAAVPQDQSTTNDAKNAAKDASKSTDKAAKNTADATSKASKKEADKAAKGAP
jgi:hypothetical protein